MYCMKSETRIEGPIEIGEFKSKKKEKMTNKELLELSKDEQLELLSMNEIIKLDKVRKIVNGILDPYEHDSVRGVWYWGKPGCGKSWKAYTDDPGAFRKCQNKWFDGYNGEDTIILDDLDQNLLGHHLKIWADRYPCQGEVKGGVVNLRHKKFVVTSNYQIDKLWEQDTEMRDAIKRRFKQIEIISPNFSLPPMSQHKRAESSADALAEGEQK